MTNFKAVIIGAWAGSYHKIVQDYGNRSEDIAEQATNKTVVPVPNLGVFNYWCDQATLDAIEADHNYWIESADEIIEDII